MLFDFKIPITESVYHMSVSLNWQSSLTLVKLFCFLFLLFNQVALNANATAR